MPEVRLATADDAPLFGRFMHDFNAEFGEPVPPPDVCAERMSANVAAGDTLIVLGGNEGEQPCGMAVLRLRGALYEDGLEAYLAELYVVPERRGQGIGRAILRHTLDLARERGAVGIDLNTAPPEKDAQRLYENEGFRHNALFWEREL